MSCRLSFVGVALASALLLASGTSFAEPTPSDRAAARALFDEGRRLMTAGNFAVACPKLEESQRIDPGIGTQFNLAECQERAGKLASAWENFLEVANSAKNANQGARETVARARAAVLAPKLGRMIVLVDPAAGDVVLKRDGVEIRRPLWGTSVPVDPGEHEIVATSAGHLPFKKSITIPAGPGTVTVSVPVLAEAPVDAPVAGVDTAPSLPKPMSTRRLAGLVVGGVGVAGLGVGGILGLVAKGKANDSKTNCDPQNPNTCNSTGVGVRNDARSLGNVATVVVVGGGVLLAAGAVLFITAPSSDARTTALGVGPGSFELRGTF